MKDQQKPTSTGYDFSDFCVGDNIIEAVVAPVRALLCEAFREFENEGVWRFYGGSLGWTPKDGGFWGGEFPIDLGFSIDEFAMAINENYFELTREELLDALTEWGSVIDSAKARIIGEHDD